MAQPKDWSAMMAEHARLLEACTGLSLAEWNTQVLDSGITTEDELRSWLEDRGVTGHPRNLVVMERFGYPAFLTASGDELIEGQYADRTALRPILDAILAIVGAFDGVEVQARKTKVSLMTPRRKFAEVTPTTRSRVDLFFRLGEAPSGRLVEHAPRAGDVMDLKAGLTGPEEVDDEVGAALERAYRANC